MNFFGQIKDKVTRYVDVYVKLFKLNFIARTSGILSYFIFAMMCMLIVLCILLFTGFGITEVFIALGVPKLASFFITVGIYLLLLCIVLGLRKPITRFFTTQFIREMTKGDDDEEEQQ